MSPNFRDRSAPSAEDRGHGAEHHAGQSSRSGDSKPDHSSHPQFYEYYKKQSESAETLARFLGLRETALRLLHGQNRGADPLRVADIGCGAGTQSLLWAELGHRVYGLDINAPLIELARERARSGGLDIDYRTGSAAALPWQDETMDVCLVPELLEHVVEWHRCLDEFARVLSRRGVLVITTNNTLCPVQHEFNLPFYSWYPPRLKRHYEKLAQTTRPQLANYAKYPAVNWFTHYSLARELRERGFDTFDRFNAMDIAKSSRVKRTLIYAIRDSAMLRFLANVATPYTLILGMKR
jgi:ubiquinone/menaquinone biosynthesis C-methylase UbiE